MSQTPATTPSPDASHTHHHRWHFFRAGGFDQVRLDSGADILHLDQLDEKLWVALSCPVKGIEFDPKTLELIDTDHDGHIRAPEIVAAAKWTASLLKNPDDLLHNRPTLPLAAINDATPEGKGLLSSAKQILVNLGKTPDDKAEISLEDTADTEKIFANTSFNGDGVLPADAAPDPALRVTITDIITCLGSQVDRSGKAGVTQDRVDRFFADAQSLVDAHAKSPEAILPLGDKTAPGFALLNDLAPKINDYFTLTSLAAFDPAAADALNPAKETFAALAAAPIAAKIRELPIARIEPDRPLPLAQGINPAFASSVSDFARDVVTPLLGQRDSLTAAEWKTMLARFDPYAAVAALPVTKLGLPRLQEIVAYRTAAGAPAKTAISDLIAKDKALEPEATSIAAVEKLIRYHRDLHRLLNNFVNFRDFYARKSGNSRAIFLVGRLYLDQRACDLCVRVDDPGKHALMAHLSRSYLAYCDLTRKGAAGSVEKMTIAAAYTAGDSDNLMVGRNGIFYDRLGRDWDATITKIIENPISIRQAFLSPYKRVMRAISDQLAKRAAAADAAATDKLQTAAANAAVGVATGTPPPPPPPPPKPKMDVGVVAALGVALGALSTAFGYFLAWLGNVPLYYIPLYFVVLILLISLPSMAIAWFKLRQRNLGPILDANGWAVNSKAKINIPFGRSLTHTPKLPPGSQRNLRDPYAEKHTVRDWTILVLLLAAVLAGLWYFGVVERVVPHVFPQSGYMIRRDEAEKKKTAAQAATLPEKPPASGPATQK